MPTVPLPYTLASLRAWVSTEIASGRPSWTLHQELSKALAFADKLEEMKALTKVMSSIEDVLVDRNLKGIALEKSGEENKAIELYESNVRDAFDGNHPYSCLRIIYKSRSDLMNAIRVCERYIALTQNDPKVLEQFEIDIAKMKMKLVQLAPRKVVENDD